MPHRLGEEQKTLKYDFDTLVDRSNTSSSKWGYRKALFGRDDVLPMWVADMDFPAPAEVVEAVRSRAEHPIYGYTVPPSSLWKAIIERLDRFYGWKIKEEWICLTAGVVNGLYSAISAYARPGDEIVVQPPVYYPFYGAVKNTGCQTVYSHLKFDGERYTMDFDGLEDLFRGRSTFPARSPRIKALILCSPHNPVGRVWTRDELATLGRICAEHECVLLSDEIHCDLLTPGARHIVTATISEEIAQNTVTFMSASKTFNLAGLGTSFVVIPNDRLRREFMRARAGHNSGNLFGYAALEAAFRYGDDYLTQLRAYLAGNLRYFTEFLKARLPELKLIRPEGTYLAWVDLRGLGFTPAELQDFIRNKARLALDDGFAFGPGGEGFQRVNLACPRSIVVEATDRLEKAIIEWRGAKKHGS